MMQRRHDGYTLIEVLMALAILAVVLALALPGFTSARGAVESTNARAALQDSLWAAMRVAQFEQQHVIVCSSFDGARCAGSTEWHRGWIAFVDRNRDREPDQGAKLLLRQVAFDGGIRIRSTPGRTRITVQPFGGASAGSNVTFTLCDVRGPAHASTAVLANTGRLRAGVPATGATVVCP